MTRRRGRGLRMTVLAVVLAGLVLPIAGGLWQAGLAAFGHLPAIGAAGPSIEPWRRLADQPGIGLSVGLTLSTGFAATALSLALAFAAVAAVHARIGARPLTRMLAPILAAPHAAMAIGLAFLLAPSGWIARLLSPWLTGWSAPPDLATIHDRYGLALVAGLVVKEVPFLILVLLAAVAQAPVDRQVGAARALGYGRGHAWAKVVFPQVYPMIRLPVYVVLAYSMSVVDMAIVLGPSNPPTLPVAAMRWFLDANAAMLLPATAAGLLQAVLVGAAIWTWRAGERLARAASGLWIGRGGRGTGGSPLLWLGSGLAGIALLLGTVAIAALAIWSVAWRWTFPRDLPEAWSAHAWMTPGAGWGPAFATTLLIGVAATLTSVLLAIMWLEGEDRGEFRRARWAEALIYLPLLVPQIAFLYGVQVNFLRLGLSGTVAAVIWVHALFVFPYVMLALSDPWRAFDRRLGQAAASLGAGAWRRLVTVKLPCLLRPILTAAAIGFAVSVAQYLPTLFAGAGRVSTLTTEAVTLSSGGDRRITGVYAVLQAVLPLGFYAVPILVPARIYRNRRGLAGGGP